jgi:hypothetical protein
MVWCSQQNEVIGEYPLQKSKEGQDTAIKDG